MMQSYIFIIIISLQCHSDLLLNKHLFLLSMLKTVVYIFVFRTL